jgi:serine/threonine protein kinase
VLGIGQDLSNYKVVSKLGHGGMGEVFQATDLKLGRDVALKVPPDEFVRDLNRVARFQHEAKVLASLNHPNIAAIYGLEQSGGINFLVLELVPGEILAEQLKRGPIPVEDSLKLALQIAAKGSLTNFVAVYLRITGGSHTHRMKPEVMKPMYRQYQHPEIKAPSAPNKFEVSPAQFVFRAGFLSGYDITSDGQRFLVDGLEESQINPSSLTVVTSWQDALLSKK